MAFTVRTSPPVQDYLRRLTGLTRTGRIKLVAGILGLLRDHADTFRSDPSRRLSPGSPFFRFDYIFTDTGRLWRADCVADDSAAVYGVLDLVYLDCQPGA